MYRDRIENPVPESFSIFIAPCRTHKYYLVALKLMFVMLSLLVIFVMFYGNGSQLTGWQKYLPGAFLYGFLMPFFACLFLNFIKSVEEFWRSLPRESDHIRFTKKQIEFNASIISKWNNLERDEKKFGVVRCNLIDLQEIKVEKDDGGPVEFLFVFKERQIIVWINNEILAEILHDYLTRFFSEYLA